MYPVQECDRKHETIISLYYWTYMDCEMMYENIDMQRRDDDISGVFYISIQ